MTDGEIVERILGGETARYGDLVDRYLPLVRGLCAGRVYDPSARDDLVQDSFVQGYLHLDRLRDRSRFSSWLAQIAVNRCRQWLRGQDRHERAVERLAVEPVPEPPDPANEAVRRELHEWVRGQVARLPEKTRDAMMLCYVEGMTIAEAARALGVRESAVKKRLQYGREVVGARLLDRFGEAGERESSAALKARVLAAVPFAAAPWKEAGAATVVAATGGAAWLLTKAALVAAPLVLVGAVVAVWTQKQSPEPTLPTATRAAASPEARAEAANAVVSNDAVSMGLTVKYAALGMTPQKAPAAANATVRLEPTSRFEPRDFDAMLREAGAWEDWQKVSAGYEQAFRSGGQDSPRGLEALRLSVNDKLDALKARLGPEEMRHRFGNAAYPLQGVEFATDGLGRASVQLRPGSYAARLAQDESAVGIDHGSPSRLTVSEEGPREAVVFVPDVLSAIRGAVIDAGSGAPPQFARVELTGEAGTENLSVVDTLHEGRFSFDPSRTGYGAFTLKVTSDYYLPAFVEGVREPGVPVELAIRLQPKGVVTGRVTDPQGRPQPGVTIWLKKSDGESASGAAETDEHGTYTLRHDGGALRLYASRHSAHSEEAVLQVRPDESATQNFVMPMTARAVFDIRKPDGTVPDKLNDQNLLWERASSSGDKMLRREGDRYVIDYLTAGTYEATFLVPDFEGVSVEFTVGPELADVSESIRLQPARVSARVRVVDSEGKPKAEAYVIAVRWRTDPVKEATGGFSRTGSGFTGMKTDEAGMAEFKGLPEGEYSFESEGTEVETVVPAQETLVIKLPNWPAPDPLRGYTISREDLRPIDTLHGNQPLPTDRVELMVLTPLNRLTDGFLEPGENTLFVGKSGYVTAVVPFTLTEEMLEEQKLRDVPALHAIEVRFGEGGSLSGVVRNETGEPVAGKGVRVYPMGLAGRYDPDAEYDLASAPPDDMWRRLGNLFAQGANTGDDGSFQVDFLPPGRYLVLIGGDILNADAPVDVRAGFHTGPVDLVRPES